MSLAESYSLLFVLFYCCVLVGGYIAKPCRLLNVGCWELGAGSRVMDVIYFSFMNSGVPGCVRVCMDVIL